MTNCSPAGAIERVIAAHLAEWDSAHVELAIYGSDDVAAIARAIEDFCCTQLHGVVGHALFYRSSIGAVVGLELEDGRRVVVKAHQPEWSGSRLDDVVRLQMYLASRGLFAPRVLAGPAPLSRGLAVAEEYIDRGMPANAHEPEVRRALATTLRTVVEALEPFVGTTVLPAADPSALPIDDLWPTPHSGLFDFEATRAGADDIDAVAAAARAHMTPAGPIVLGHGDWRAEHVHFEGTTPIVAFDWDSLCEGPEPALIGSTAHAFCADWDRPNHVQAPTLDEARAFIADYEAARGRSFGSAERRLCGGAFAYAVAYTARCSHALGHDDRRELGTFQHLVATYGHGLLAL
jgi:Phosphotransferase enzyme family